MNRPKLKQAMLEAAEIHKNLLCERPSDIRRNITAVKHALIARWTIGDKKWI